MEFLGCSNEEMNGKSIRTDFVATYFSSFIMISHGQTYYHSITGIALAVGALSRLALLAGLGGGGECAPGTPPISALRIKCEFLVYLTVNKFTYHLWELHV